MRVERSLAGVVMLMGTGFLMLLCSCHSPKKVDHKGLSAIDRIWKKHENAVVSALRTARQGGELDKASFTAAVEFFEETTGIISNTGTHFGRLPTKELESTLARWRLWYSENIPFLYLEPGTSRVRVDTAAKARANRAPRSPERPR